MATVVKMKHKELGIFKEGFFEFSWTTLFFGPFPALFRSDFGTFAAAFGILFLINLIMFSVIGVFWYLFSWIPNLAWAFMYNKYFTRKLIEKGYVFNDTESVNKQAADALGVSTSSWTAPSSVAGVPDSTRPTSGTLPEELERLAKLHAEGQLTDDEFKELKQKLIR